MKRRGFLGGLAALGTAIVFGKSVAAVTEPDAPLRKIAEKDIGGGWKEAVFTSDQHFAGHSHDHPSFRKLFEKRMPYLEDLFKKDWVGYYRESDSWADTERGWE